MRQIGDDIWVHEDTMKMVGTKLGLRMTIVRLSDGGVWIHSPTAISADLRKMIDDIGPVTAIVAANDHHSKWLQEWCEAYPEADAYVSAGIPRKVPLSIYHILQQGLENAWPEDFVWKTMPAVPMFNETVFLHKKSSSLIVTDFIQNYPEATPQGFAGLIKNYVFEPIGFKGQCVAPPFRLGMTRKNKPAFSEFVRDLQTWDFSQIVVTHGDIITENAPAVFKDLSARFLD
ncbi:DUF4336 domain-containing protein [Photobacterium makurazakiensis]|uniref:DUF4336 domain-containing protein n=1 Tax=Photobacterium makurazakiensis TaxID=2910234 RepID=UPI003D0B08D3